jgi:hypothetical protein
MKIIKRIVHYVIYLSEDSPIPNGDGTYGNGDPYEFSLESDREGSQFEYGCSDPIYAGVSI